MVTIVCECSDIITVQRDLFKYVWPAEEPITEALENSRRQRGWLGQA